MTPFTTSAPGRLCLFGEHQDYLGLPVVAMAINRRCHLTWTPRKDSIVRLTSESRGTVSEMDLDRIGQRAGKNPWGVALVDILRDTDATPEGMDIHIRSDIPIQAGCSSSTALMTAWTAGWSRICGLEESTDQLVHRCHRAEVLAFDGAGGDMDHFACAHGGIHRFGLGLPQALTPLSGAFILGDSGQPKDTQGHLARCKEARLPLMADLDMNPPHWSEEQRHLAEGTRINRDLEAKWAGHLSTGEVDVRRMGEALTRHHEVLRDVLGLSTPRIEAMLEGALNAGAWGAKINGSGGGGCLFAYTAESHVDSVIEAMMAAGAKGAWTVHMDEGVRHG
jgi:galactokinase